MGEGRFGRSRKTGRHDPSPGVHKSRPRWPSAVTVIVMLGAMGLTWGTPGSTADAGSGVEFYTPPQPLPDGRPGDLIRFEPSQLRLEPSGQLGAFVATGTRIMYRSNDTHGNPDAVTGTYFEPDNPWPGHGPRPLIALAVSTYGQGDQCAPSRIFDEGIHFSSGLDIQFGYDEMFVATMVARGFAVVVTDYEGLGTPGMHTYANRVSEGNALIDAARAAMRLPNTSLDPHGPVAFWGYSQGGGAAASAAELAPHYAPELNVVGARVGAPPANLYEALPFMDGSTIVGMIGYLLNGLIAAYPEAEPAIRRELTADGENLLNRTRDQCAIETVLTYSFHRAQEYFTRDPSEVFQQEPLKSLLDEQRIGRSRPAAPVMIDLNRWDPLTPWSGGHQLALDWCAQGADVELRTNEEPPFLNKLGVNHVLTYVVDGEQGLTWIADRFNGLPTTPNCGGL